MSKKFKILFYSGSHLLSPSTLSRLNDGENEIQLSSEFENCIALYKNFSPDLFVFDFLNETKNFNGFLEVISGINGKAAAVTNIILVRPESKLKTPEKSFTLKIVQNPADPEKIIELLEALIRLKKSEKSLFLSKVNYRQIVESALEGIWQIDEEENTTYVNNRMAEMLGYSQEEMLDKPLYDFIDPFDKIKAEINVKRRKEGIAERHEFRFLKKDGSYVWTSLATNPIYDEGEKYAGALALVVDISEKKSAGEKLLERELNYTALIENSSDAIYVLQNDQYVLINAAWEKMFGYSREEIVGTDFSFYNIVAPESVEMIKERVRAAEKGIELSGRYEMRGISRSGKLIDLEVSASNIMWKGKPAIQGFYRDVTNKNRAQKALEDSEKKYRQVVENASELIYMTDHKGKFTFANHAALNMVDYSLEELREMNYLDLILPDHRKRITKFFMRQVIKRENITYAEFPVLTKGRGIKWFGQNSSIIIENDELTGFHLIARDITERKQAEEKINMLALALKNVSEGVSVTDLNDNIIFVNSSFLSMYGYEEREIIGKNINVLRSVNNDPDIMNSILPATLKGGWQGELLNLRKDGTEFPIYLSTALIPGESNKPFAIIGVASDITERKRSIAELVRTKEKAVESDRIKSNFLAQISHEIRTPLNIILSYNSLIKEELGGTVNEEIRNMFDTVWTAGHRLIRTIELILNMSAIHTGQYEVKKSKVDLNSVLQALVEKYLPLSSQKSLDLYLINEAGNVELELDKYAVSLVFQNLIDNAIKYAHEGEIVITVYKDKKEKVCVDVKDTGIGIAQVHFDRIFLPFTQEDEGYTRAFDGNGLGLAVVRHYSEINNAEVKVKSEKGKGSIFTVIFHDEKEDSIKLKF